MIYIKIMKIKWYLLTFLILLIENVNFINSEYYSSIYKMSILMNTEQKILENFESFIMKNANKLKFLKETLAHYEQEHKEALLQGPVYFENPVNKFMLNKRLTNDWEKIENVMFHQDGKDILNNIKGYYIKNAEYEGGIDGFLRLQDTYRLNTTDMAQGILNGIQYNSQLEARHCYDIGKRASTGEYKRLGYHWLKEALKRYKKPKSKTQFSPSKLRKLNIELSLTNAKYEMGDFHGANQSYVDLINRYPKSIKVAKEYSKFLDSAKQNETIVFDYTMEHEPIIENMEEAGPNLTYKYTCAGIYKKTPHQQRHLLCGYLTETHPFLILAPIKVEEMNHDPLVVVFHDVVYDNEIEIMKNLTTSIERAKVMSTNQSRISTTRTSQFLFLDVTAHPVLGIIDRRVEDMTNFNMKYVERHQFANYGVGGHYGLHHDYFSKAHMTIDRLSSFHMGNRIATVLFYLSDVEQGGGTVFPFLKLHLAPKKGAAAFWFNLHASGKNDVRTIHGACPIIVGSKWVQNRWIREHDQSDRRPCLLYDDAKYYNTDF